MVDYIFRLLAFEYLGRTDLVHVTPEQLEEMGRSSLDISTEAEGSSADTEAIATPTPQQQPKAAPQPVTAEATTTDSANATDASQAHLSNMMGDAPTCDKCGHITVRNGTCYKCLNCGESLGCS